MFARRLHRLALSLAALLVVAVSGMAASQMAPDRDTLARAASLAAIGAQPGDICGTETAHAAHCPLCHLLSDPPVPAPEATILAWRGAAAPVLPPEHAVPLSHGPPLGSRAPPMPA